MVSGATRAFESISKSFMNAKVSSVLCQLDTKHLCTRIRSFSAVSRLSLRPSCVDAHLSPTSSVSGLADDAYIPFERDWNFTKGSMAGATARSRVPTIDRVAQRAKELRSNAPGDQRSSFSMVEHADDFEPDIELREDLKTGISSLHQLLGGSFGGFSHPSLGCGPGARPPMQPQNPPADTTVDIKDAVVELSLENIDAIASEISPVMSTSDARPQIESVGGRPSRYMAETHPARARRTSSAEQTSQATSKTPSESFIKRPRESWQIQKAALQRKFGEGSWQPRKRLSPDALEGIRALHAQYPNTYTTPVLADQFKVSPEAIRRILKSKWRPSEEEAEERRERWTKRGEKIWSQMVELGVKPPKKWREMGIGQGRIPRSAQGGKSNGSASSRSRPRKQWSGIEEPERPIAVESAPLGERIL